MEGIFPRAPQSGFHKKRIAVHARHRLIGKLE